MKSFVVLICILFGSILLSLPFATAREFPDGSSNPVTPGTKNPYKPIYPPPKGKRCSSYNRCRPPGTNP